MGFRKASGTKPSNLASQVPGEEMREEMPEAIQPSQKISSVKNEDFEQVSTQAPEVSFGQMDMGSMAPSAPASPAATGFEDLPSLDEYGDLPSMDEGEPASQTDVNNFELDLIGKKAKIENGKASFYDEDSKEWKTPSGTEKFIAAMMLDSISNAPAIASQMGGAAATFYGGPLAMAVGGTAAGMAGATQNENVLNSLRQNPEANKYITALEAISGEPASPMGVLETGALSVIGEGLGAVLGKAFQRGAKMLRGGEKQMAEAFAESVPKAEATEQAAKRLGIDVKAADVAATVPGGGEIAEKEAMAAAGLLGKEAKIAYERQVVSQRDALKTVLQDAKRMVGGEASPFSPEYGISGVKREGFEKKNIVDQYIDRWKETLSGLRSGVSETAKKKKYDPTQLMSGVVEIVRTFPDAVESGVIRKDGFIDIRKLDAYAKNFLKSEQDAQILVNQVNLLQNIINRDSTMVNKMGSRLNVVTTPASTEIVTSTIPSGYPGVPGVEVVEGFRFRPQKSAVQPGTGIKSFDNLPPTIAGEAEAGFNFDQISSIVDRFQDLAVKSGDGKMAQLAGMALQYENDIMQKAYKEAGNAKMADTVMAAKEVFYNEIDTVSKIRDTIMKGIEKSSLGDAIISMPPEEIKLFKSFLKPDELAEARMKAFNSAVLNESILNPNQTINASYIQNKFFKNERTRESMLELFGKEGVDNLSAALNIAKVLENKKLSPQAYVRVTNDLSGQLMKMEKKLGVLQYGKAFIGFLSGSSDKTAKLLSENISKYKQVMKPIQRKKTAAMLDFGAEAASTLQNNQVGKEILLENLLQKSGEEAKPIEAQ